ncbi:IS1380 family transposase [Microlunatus elymi]|uniref:IS1380 family transposase n=2 Tax=Microlunatus elymi TaxID=2596828 RepID=A0A516PTU7_9ACTN|nr:IS1380 family transposase [Microlunatus elymi]QDP94813.1 IS1380 family transposase [Microlunatus elymi]QDP95038.1 IS1380 family transposase [Microlunatus elymi]QDP95214.1 IS1380 family transposase [Microlunatus elymi]QDP95301.1 IS1380 family transposase [Microlunatus elymi]
MFDEEHLVSCAGLAPVMGLAERAGLSELLADRVRVDSAWVASSGVNPAGKVTSIIAGMAAGADCIDDLDVIRAGGTARLFKQVYAPATLGQFLRNLSHGHTSQLASVARAHLVNLVGCSDLLPGIEQRALIDIDSLLRPVYGHAKEGASFGHAKIAGKQVLRKGLSPLVTTISTTDGAPVVAGIRLRAGKAGSGRGAASMVTEAIGTARQAGATGEILVRGDSAYGNHLVAGACLDHGVRFSLVLTRNAALDQAIASIAEDAWTAVHYPGAVVDPDTGVLISDAQVAEVEAFTAFASTARPITARLVVRRVRDVARLDELFPVWRYHPFLTNSLESVTRADVTHRQHAIIETVHSDLIDGPLAHLPSGRFAANTAWAICAGICHNLLRAAGSLVGGRHAVARGATLRRHLIMVPARIARPARRKFLHLPAHWPWADQWLRLWHHVFTNSIGPPAAT